MPLFNPAIPPQEAWKTPALLGNWDVFDTTHNTPGYWKDSMGVVHLRGLVKNGTFNTNLFLLPAGYRPAKREVLPAASWSGSAMVLGRLSVYATGEVIPVVGGAGWFSLDGATFRAT